MRSLSPARALALGALLLVGGCAGRGRLAQYDFRDRTLAVVVFDPPAPEVFGVHTSQVDVHRPLESVLRVGSAIALEAGARRARARLDSAAAAVRVEQRIGDRVLDGAARQLRARAVDDRRADFEIELHVTRLGIAADDRRKPATYIVEADAFLVDGPSGRRIWKQHVWARDVVHVPGTGVDVDIFATAANARALAELPASEIQRELELISDLAADELVSALANSLARARG